ncbi:4.5S-RNP protein [Candidatus Blochmanniella pennsylvanica str. BPEN]|uniref:signal-recognition-particle GTPase n=1 Tax=Blochmanniella pennsylvanica (strain BPEN) TaxID=291272 RepID=Q493M4_BLOPB|nr:signal recognition particle protein [Candidatus Blochmannia pennsylvanicus]AAZ40816.1 4.5S-RNP protein [Candidatus Blochmannia pennsylvanicus str. BPEN]UOY04591.1 signal recognition particle protein [Candidatus Blochmannia pennsylvanicus]
MFKKLSNKISQSIRNIVGSGRLTENNIKETLNMVKIALLEGDVALPVVHGFVNTVKEGIIGSDINKHLTPGQEFIKIMHASLVKIMGEGSNDLNLNTQTPSIILIVGAQGSGKTTTTGKLAKFLKIKKNKKILVASTDVYRPAGVQQLKSLIKSEDIIFFEDCNVRNKPIDILKAASIVSRSLSYDVLLIDTAGCLETDDSLLSELAEMHSCVNPIETLFIVDSMIGQVAINSINVFNKTLPLTGIILTKLDGDSRGGVALSIKYLTGKPIKFIGTGEKIDALEPFNSYRIAGRILGMGDILSLIEDIDNQSKWVKEKKYINKNSVDFNLYDFLGYIKQIRSMGGINKIIGKLPLNLGVNLDNIQSYTHDNTFIRMEAIINSMTVKERMNPKIITGSRKKRIANGSGVHVQDVTKLLNTFNHIRITIQKINKNEIFQMIRTLKNKISSKFTIN